MKAMILAAGRGRRLQPLTDQVPKPLLPVANRPQTQWVLELLRRGGVTDVMINCHHLGDEIRDVLGKSYGGSIRINYSFEEEILGTAGGLKKVEDFFDEDPFIVINADTLIDVDLAEVVRRHGERGAAATMVVREWDPEGGYGRVEMDDEGRIVRILEMRKGGAGKPVVFTGVHVMSRAVFSYIPRDHYWCINADCYAAMLEEGEKIEGFPVDGYWRDIGTLRGYYEANRDFLHGRMPEHCREPFDEERALAKTVFSKGVKIIRPVLVSSDCEIEDGCRIGPEVVLGEGCVVKEGARVERVVGFQGALFEAGERVKELIRAGPLSVGFW